MSSEIRKNIIYRVFEAVITICSSIAQYALLTRYLSQEDVGKYSLFLACLFFVNAFSYLAGTMSVATREITQGKDQREIVTSTFALQLAIAIILAAILLPLISTLNYFAPIRDGLLIATTIFLILAAPFSFQAILNAKKEMAKIACINITGQLISLSLLIICILNNASLFLIYLAFISLNITQVILSVILSKWQNYFSIKSFNLKQAINIFKESSPIVLMVIATHLYVRIDVFMIDYFHSKEDVALYTSAYNFIDYLMILSNTIMLAVFPNFTELVKTNATGFKQLYKKIILIFTIYLAPIAILIAVFSPFVLNLVYGANYSQAYIALVILMIATVFAWLNGPSGTIFIAYKKQSIYTWGVLVSLIVNIIGNLLLIPTLGYEGAAISTVLTEVVLVSFCLFYIYKLTNYVPFLCRIS